MLAIALWSECRAYAHVRTPAPCRPMTDLCAVLPVLTRIRPSRMVESSFCGSVRISPSAYRSSAIGSRVGSLSG